MKKIIMLCIILAVTIFWLASCDLFHTHQFGEWVILKEATCAENGEMERYCCCGDKQTEVIYATGEHNEVVLPAVEPTCTESGLTEGKYCSKCGAVTVAQQVVPVEHILVNGKCENCDYTYSVGLEYVSNGDGTCYVGGKGSCTDIDIVIPAISPDGDTVITIGEEAFFWCRSISSVAIPDSVTTIGKRAFYWCFNLAFIEIPDSVTTIGDEAFSGSNSLTSVVIPDSVTTIGNGAFSDCTSLISVVIPDSVTTIVDYPFAGCTGLTSITVDTANEYYKSIDGNLYTKDGKTLIHYAIGKADSEFVIPDSVTTIGKLALYGCTALTSVVIPDSVTTIGNKAFSGCDSLISVIIGNSVTTIGWNAFSDCIRLTSVVIPDSVTTIDDFAFSDCTGLTSITVDKDNEYYKSINGNLYTKDGKTLIQYAIGKTDSEFVIPDSVTTIGDFAFSCSNSLTSVVIPDSVTTIGDFVFSYCTGLISVVIPDGVTTIGKCAFYDCTMITDVYYTGSEEEWAKISIGSGNDYLTKANFTYGYVQGN